MNEVLQKYLPEQAVLPCFELIKTNGVHLKIVDHRVTRHGDYRRMADGKHQITVNASLNKYRFLITLVHEIAHLVAFERFGRRIKPHGKEWKQTFQELMKPVLSEEVFPEPLLSVLKKHMLNPKASSASDPLLWQALNPSSKIETLLIDLEDGSHFEFKNRSFKKKSKRRTRVLCEDLKNGKKYLIPGIAAVERKV